MVETKRSSMGFYEEKLFEHAVNKYLNGVTCRKAKREEDMYQHIDFFLSDGRNIDNQEYLLTEFLLLNHSF